ncbi:uncharacterized protein BDW47DRAFT_87954 [Aspergillus candidus]|uniref:Uncharacterized protein n=1 Tax=Aspergillus candidus TaxID=41067 RepID=A0A2I2FIJ6_ASPCN|nr:hypothetical protein BDW47DRAFT_87954 [Aspergillus candidus]PLB40457.1 hypothetical protein BDW47DRAFT_87954 [Aspergillus candidus]
MFHHRLFASISSISRPQTILSPENPLHSQGSTHTSAHTTTTPSQPSNQPTINNQPRVPYYQHLPRSCAPWIVHIFTPSTHPSKPIHREIIGENHATGTALGTINADGSMPIDRAFVSIELVQKNVLMLGWRQVDVLSQYGCARRQCAMSAAGRRSISCCDV